MFGFDSSLVSEVLERPVEVVEVGLRPPVELEEEVKDFEGKRSLWPIHGGRVPSRPENLRPEFNGEGIATSTLAVPHADGMNTVNVDDGEVVDDGGVGTTCATMA